MKKAEIRKIEDMHTNRLLMSITLSFLIIVVLMVIHRVWTAGNYMSAIKIKLAVSNISFAVMIVLLAVMIWKKKWYLVEYVCLFAVMSLLFYGMHGTKYVNAQKTEKFTYWAIGAYIVGTIVFHSVAPKIIVIIKDKKAKKESK